MLLLDENKKIVIIEANITQRNATYIIASYAGSVSRPLGRVVHPSYRITLAVIRGHLSR